MTDPYYATPFFPAAPLPASHVRLNDLLRQAAGRGPSDLRGYNEDEDIRRHFSGGDDEDESPTSARITRETLVLLDTRPSASADQLSATTSAALAQALGVSALEKATGYVTAGLNGVVSQLIELLGLAQTALTEAGFAVTGEVTDADLADAVAAVHAAAESRGTPSGNQAYTNRVSLTLALALHAGDLRAARRVGPAIGSA